MDRKKTLTLMFVLTLFFTTCVFLAGQNIALADECKIITIKGGGRSGVSTSLGSIISADPKSLHVTAGTCVVWVNFAHANEVRVVFKDGKACSDVTDTPRGFSLDDQQCYVTNYLPLGGTSSLIFDNEGEYEYILEHGREETATGRIIVKRAPGMPEEVAAEKGPVDTDGDGVPDSVDLCPNTPKGATVNKKGCWALKGLLLFDFDSSTIKPEAYPLLDEVAVILENNPEMKGEIRGHTDSMGPAEYNQQLSEKRAGAIDKYLENKGIDSSRWIIKGYGESQPLASNETEEGRLENRRVELVRIQD